MLSLAFKVSPFFSVFTAAHHIVNALLPTLQIFITAWFINTAIDVYQGAAEMPDVYAPVAMFAGLMVYNALNDVVMGRVHCRRDIHFRGKLMPAMLAQQAQLAYRHIENPDTADLINRVCPEIDKNIIAMYTGVLNLVKLAVFSLGIIVTLFSQIWWVGLLMATSAVPLVYIANKAGKETYQANRDVTKYTRRADYLSAVLMGREAAEERSIFGYGEALNRQYGAHYEYARKFTMKAYIQNFIKYKAGALVAAVYPVAAMFVLIGPTVSGALDIGMFIALVTAIFNLAERLSQGIGTELTELIRHREYLRDLTHFMSLEKVIGAEAEPHQPMSFKKIEFKDVRFRYPHTEKLVLDGISFVIEKGKHYAFVGENGAGKTTITKLISGLYTNYEGEILVDGRPLRAFSPSELKGLASIVYQDYAKYYISLYDNIAIGDLHRCNRGEVLEAANAAGLSEKVSALENGIDTPLGKIIENGADISGGEWQRVAMARSIVSKAPLRILDEPTAALDPISESAVYRNFEKISAKDQDRTTIFISHRLGAAKLADVIFVLSEGTIAEKGPHKDLLALNGIYAEMFAAQAQWYSSAERGEVQ